MSGAQGHDGTVEAVASGLTPMHRLDPRVKIVGFIGFAVVAVTTPVAAWGAFAAYSVLVLGLHAAARLPVRYVLKRSLVEIPFLLAAALLVLTAPEGPELGVTVALKATIGVQAMILLSSTTPFPALLQGFERLRAPRLLIMIVAFMWRYLHVLGEELRRMRMARDARAWQGRWMWQAAPVGAMLATLFLRALERGERTHLAMLSRGYTGGVPATVTAPLALRALDGVFLGGIVCLAAAIRLVAA